MSLFDELSALAKSDPRALEARLKDMPFPHVDGNQATFAFRGRADEVILHHWVFGLQSAQPFERVGKDAAGGGDLWLFRMDIPAGSRMEYKLEVVRGGQHQLVQDPLNPHAALDPYGANSVLHGEGYEEPFWAQEDEEVRPGEIHEMGIGSDVFGELRPVQVYLPARFNKSRRYPLLIVHDGDDFLRFSNLRQVLDNLIHRLEIPAMIVAMTTSPDRLNEYADDPRHARFIAEELVPLLEERYPLVETPAARGLLGASFGAVAALSTAWRHPGVFGNLCLLSGSFAFTDIGEHDRGPLFDPVVEFVNAFREDPGKPADRVFLACGTYESLIYYNRSMVPLLQGTGMDVRFEEARDGHNWENWRDRLRMALSWLYPGPLWLIYE